MDNPLQVSVDAKARRCLSGCDTAAPTENLELQEDDPSSITKERPKLASVPRFPTANRRYDPSDHITALNESDFPKKLDCFPLRAFVNRVGADPSHEGALERLTVKLKWLCISFIAVSPI